LDAQTKAELRYALSESRLPIKVDVVEWARLPSSFQDLVQKNHVVLIAK